MNGAKIYQSRNSTNMPVATNAKNKTAPTITIHIALRSFPGLGMDIPRNEMNSQKAERRGSFARSNPWVRSVGNRFIL